MIEPNKINSHYPLKKYYRISRGDPYPWRQNYIGRFRIKLFYLVGSIQFITIVPTAHICIGLDALPEGAKLKGVYKYKVK